MFASVSLGLTDSSRTIGTNDDIRAQQDAAWIAGHAGIGLQDNQVLSPSGVFDMRSSRSCISFI
jgi:hypothetical protein